MARKIYETGWWYDHLRYVTDAYIRASYRKLEFVGLEKIPSEGAVIFAPNHCCALMDPLAVLILSHEAKVFVARADIFANPFVAKVLNFLKIMPINRIRDGLRSVAKTADTIDRSIEVLNNGVKFCILPEGTHRPMHSLMPIGKGIARVACGAVEGGVPGKVWIVPVGLEYGDYYRFRTTLLVQIGEPVDASSIVESMQGAHERDVMDALRSALEEELKRNIVYIGDDGDYPAKWELAKIASGEISPFALKERFRTNRKAVERVEKIVADAPGKARELFDKANGFAARRRSAGVSLESLAGKHPARRAAGLALLCLVAFPLFAIMAAASLPVWLTAELVVRKLEDKAFRNSFRCGILILGWTLMLIVWAVVLFCSLKWYLALPALLLLTSAPFVVYDCFELARQLLSALRCLRRRDLKRDYDDLKKEMKQIWE